MLGGDVKTSEDCANADNGKMKSATAMTRDPAERRTWIVVKCSVLDIHDLLPHSSGTIARGPTCKLQQVAESGFDGRARPAVCKYHSGPLRMMFALLNTNREGKRRASILLCIADRAENCSVEPQMFGDVQSNSSHWIKHLMNNSSAATKVERTQTVLPAEMIFASVDAACELSASGPFPGAVLRATGILHRQFDRDR